MHVATAPKGSSRRGQPPTVQPIRRMVRLPRRRPWQRAVALDLADPEVMFVLAAVGRRAGKSHIGSDVAGRTAMRTKEEVPWVAPKHQISEKGREIFTKLWDADPDRGSEGALQGAVKQSPPARANMVGGGRVVWYTSEGAYSAKEGGKGIGLLGGGYPLVILDEAARIPWPLVEQEIMPTIADTGGKILAITTPRGKKNWTYKWFKRAQEGNPLYRAHRGPTTLNPNPAVQRFVDVMREEMDALLFQQEILGEFLEGEGTVFRRIAELATLDGYLDAPPSTDREYAIGCDVAKHQDWTVLYALDLETGHVVATDRFQHLSWPVIEERIADFAATWPGVVWLDSTGVGDPVYDHLVEADVPVQGTKFTNESKARLVQGLSTAMDKGRVRYPDDEGLRSELEEFDYELLPSGRFRYGAPEGEHDDRVIALALAVHGMNRAITGLPI